ncbi:family 10 glycosylhydrolase [Okeania sp.]|uniref:family 10 glycosylhydrolase n=1 Tax=Okeania sp. TaxID=3100323 RepID=UPI002B4B8BC8|nr:family 10 glycosylhydrolase [Okeania sp.]MEB3343351.1 family 10 glycosylhydrolase [Okeania sp.]
MVLLPTPVRANVLLGIIRDSENTNEWNQIITRIDNLGISYQPIDLQQINTLADLSGIKVIFLPNIQTLTKIQVETLEEWVKQGGKLIASGQIGRKSQAGVRQKLRSLLGSYWAFPLSQPTTPEPKYRCLDIACQESTGWAPQTNNQDKVTGGVLIPAGLNSRTAATWQGSSGSAAVVVSPQATYLGWNWGNNGSATVDSIWFQAILNRYQNQPQFSNSLATTNNSNPVKIKPRTSPSPTPNNENVNMIRVQPRTTVVNSPGDFNNNQPGTNPQNPIPDGNNIQLRSQQQTTNIQPQETNLSSNNNSVPETTTPPQINNTLPIFSQQRDQKNQTSETVSRENTSDSNTRKTTNNRIPQQRQEENPKTETVSNNDVPVNSANSDTSELTDKVRDFWERFRERRTNPSSSGNSTTALLRPLPAPAVQIPDFEKDPSSSSAPPGLQIRRGNYPISRSQSYAMIQELNNLLGRFESALVAAQSANVEVNLAADDVTMVAANNDQTTFMAQRNQKIENAQQVASTARQVIQQFPQLVTARQYATARDQWLNTRQMLWNNYPTDGERAGAEIRAVWLDRGTIVRARSERGLASVFDRLAAAGINTVFFETINAGYTIYPSNIAPKQNPLTTSWDPLAAAVKLAHERNMEIHAWMWTFAVGNRAHNRAVGQPDSYLGPVITAHPSWVMTDNRGRQRHPNDTKVYMDPANPYVRQYLLKLIDEIASRYDVDGIQLDYIRYPFQDYSRNFSYGYSTTARNQFRQLHGIDPMRISWRDRQNLSKWNQFKVNQVNSFVANTSQFLKQKYPNLILSAAVFPFPRNERFYKIQQDWETWVSNGEIDLLTPMTYALDTNRFQQITQPLANTGVLGSTLITPAVKLLNIPEIVAVDQIQAARDLPTGGYIIFAAERITGGLHGFLTRTQGASETGNGNRASLNAFVKPAYVVEGLIPYRQPFAAAADRFQALKKEWSFLLGNQQISLAESDIKSWREEAEDLALALEKLADNPNSNNLNKAKSNLRKFQLKFRNLMTVHARGNPYQVQTWQNRLSSLEMLLNYGERVKLNSERF